jgi:hypothetical protein
MCNASYAGRAILETLGYFFALGIPQVKSKCNANK